MARVASRISSFQFCNPGADIREVGRQLSVGALLEGSVRKADDRLRVTVQLIEGFRAITAGRSASTVSSMTFLPSRMKSRKA
jgi:TolB-like protein